jgi:mediator of RNA polymerase II transcription subunit 7
LSTDASQHAEKIEDLRTLFVNFHHLLNEYRPHQARESLVLMMQEQLERSRAETRGILEMKGRVEGLLEGLGGAMLADSGEKKIEEKEEVDEEKEVWDEVWRTFG